MLKGKLDIKIIFILVLAGALILSFIFRPTTEIDLYEDEIELLKEENKVLIHNNNSLNIENRKLDKEIEGYLIKIDSTQVLLYENKNKINDLENGKNEVSSYVNGLNANGVASSLTDYLNKR
jgi:regulator of replication initiation timing